MIPLSVDVPMKRLPWANWGLILATVVVSLAVPYAPGEGFTLLPDRDREHELSPLVLQPLRFEPYQLVTSLFQHAGLIHLAGNMLFLFVFGNAINAKVGHLVFLGAYLGIGVLENLAWTLAEGPPCLGASAAVMGICGMFLILYPRNGVRLFWDDSEVALLTRSWTAELPGWAVVVFYLAFDIWGAFFKPSGGVAHVAHLLGGVLGAGLAVLLLRAGWLAPDPGEQTLFEWLAGEGPVGKVGRVKKTRGWKVKRKA